MKITDTPLDKIIPHLVDSILSDERFLEERIAVDLNYWLDKKNPLIAAGGNAVQPTDDPLIIALALLQCLQKQMRQAEKAKEVLELFDDPEVPTTWAYGACREALAKLRGENNDDT